MSNNSSELNMQPYFEVCAEKARRQTRSITSIGMPPVQDDEYGFLDCYCNDVDCDCRRSVIQVHSRQQGIVAVFNYGWESPEFYKQWSGNDNVEMLMGAWLDPFGIKCHFAYQLLDEFRATLKNDSE